MNVFIINPVAGNKDGIELVHELKKIKNSLIHVTENKNDAIDFLNYFKSYHDEGIIYSIGGDGTLNEVINGIYDSNFKLHIVPNGSGNDYHRIIKNELELKVPVGEVNKRKFINIASLGVDADIVNKVNKDKIMFLKYQRNILKTLLTYKKKEININNSNELINIVAVCLGKYYGNGVPINPEYNLNEETFNLLIASDMNKLEMIKCFLDIFNAKHLENKKVSTSKVSNLKITSKVPIICNVDGEILIDQEFTFKLLPQKITITNKIPSEIKK